MSRHRRKRAYRRRKAIRACYRSIVGEIQTRTKAAIDAHNEAQRKRIEAQVRAVLARVKAGEHVPFLPAGMQLEGLITEVKVV